MKVTITLPFEKVRNMLALASTDETRMIINGVFVEASPLGVLLVATDGRRIGVMNVEDALVSDEGKKFCFLIHRDLIQKVPTGYHLSEVTFDEDANRITITAGATDITEPQYEGKYPNWREVIPEGLYRLASNIKVNPCLLYGFAKAAGHDCEAFYHAAR